MIFRTYIDKSNTIISGSHTNTSLNPVSELYFGGPSGDTEYTRLLFHFDASRLIDLYTGGTITDLTKLSHKLRMVNTGSLDKRLLGQNTGTCVGKDRSSSFDLVIFPATQYWDQGIGYDYDDCTYTTGAAAFYQAPSNWFSATTLSAWTESGVVSGDTTGLVIASQHFELGNENLEMDITDHVNSLITGDTNNGLVLAYQRQYELLTSNTFQYVGFFTPHTQSIYEPFVETIYSQTISDDRNDFFLDRNNKLYLYVNLGGNPTNLDSIPSVVIQDNNGTTISAYTPSNVTHVTKGVYSIDINIATTTGNNDGVLYSDIWSGLSINGITRPNVTLDFELKPSDCWYNIGSNNQLPKKVSVVASGIQRGEAIKRGDIRKVIINTKIPYTVNQEQKIDSAEYRLYVKEGNNEFTVSDFHPIELANTHNYFLLDTPSLIPSTYYVDIKVKSNLEVTTLKEVLYFDIVSESNQRPSQ